MPLICLLVLLLWLVFCGLRLSTRFIAWLLSRSTRHRTNMGSARFATKWKMFLAGVTRGSGPIVGRARGKLLRFNKDGMIIVFAPMGAGKGVGIVIPNLLSYRGSIVCTDIKGENHAITQRHRRKLGFVYVLNTARPEHSDRFNPLDTIRVGTRHEKDDAEALAKLLIVPDGQEGH